MQENAINPYRPMVRIRGNRDIVKIQRAISNRKVTCRNCKKRWIYGQNPAETQRLLFKGKSNMLRRIWFFCTDDCRNSNSMQNRSYDLTEREF